MDKGASVIARLKNKAKETGKPFQLHLQLFCQEEFLRRLAASRYAENLVLKGGLFIYTLTNFESRATVDIDFSYQGNPDETNFDVMNVLTSEGMHELDDLFYELCKESKIKNPIIESITIIESTPSYKQLLNA